MGGQRRDQISGIQCQLKRGYLARSRSFGEVG